MKPTFFLVVFLCVGMSFLNAQEEGDKEVLQKKTIQVTDSITIPVKIGDLTQNTLVTNVKDSVVFSLNDMESARLIDSLWLKELYSTGRFEEMYGTILDEDYEPVEYEELPTEVLKQRLQELNARTPFNVEYNPSLESVIKGYLKNRRRTMARLMALSDYYFPMFEEQLDKHGLPLEMKYLAIVESALDPRARSRVGATGLWQFMYSTGKIFGLEVNSYVDERSDPVMATEAACQYLKSLEKSLGDWDLALAAYNSGPGNVSKALRRAGGHTNYWNIRHHLPRETAGYVPAFLATMYIFEFAEEHGFKSSGPKFPYIATDTVRVKNMIALEHVAKVTNLEMEELTFLNPSYKHEIIPVVKDEDYVLRLPVDAVGKFVANEEAVYAYAAAEFNSKEKPLPQYFEQSDRIRYRVRSGDYLGKIASKYGVTVSQIKRWNSLRSTRLRIGQRLTIYPRGGGRKKSSGSKATVSNTSGAKTYTVKNGDSLWSISQKFPGVTVDNIRKWNDISGNKLKPGMKLKIQKG
ncbi:MAG: LysM peptidoglycan-binding domain-containing protein [Bacteroidia bacterium]|nr:LysM peptidoglycan-binding domain-containing protein [Bacteroidia bacterium]NNF31502.1 LysM peptidoglycan-binding domain-containing protein [Flavobacteriaceae bacterium]MBT8275577.1 LysM peptidoglycan-binding domain-containing protein [Bacteroidia bacterium]NNJ82767.1 LysM peptidoglycan-binding domain-containing protein [Flavobacteriaceae bacterium]NNK54081.1 LysM peptidoglycan-binding domain-containing protein [Flavobacteriaceae bacterium]